ncbi:unnamed protein product [Didymodactylos carnosus]|uniref:Uncharacterized protein n=1 Tax=Didymodactylos carnosus TaxID=1234261 RepID=A0A8S2H1L5_9BILA|nr:unnamed protein product [Didymodactylos carnosus]CAF3583237.1 unnamed protein product [Didymodactylos carnosus]
MDTCSFTYISKQGHQQRRATGIERTWEDLKSECGRTGDGCPNAKHYLRIGKVGPELFTVTKDELVFYHDDGQWHQYITAKNIKYGTTNTPQTPNDDDEEGDIYPFDASDERILHTQLENLVDDVKQTDNVEAYIDEIRSERYKKVLLIITNNNDDNEYHIVNEVHDVRSLHSIHIYNNHERTDKKWDQCFVKLKLYNDIEQILENLSTITEDYATKTKIPLSVFNQSALDMTTNELNDIAYFAKFVSPLLIDLLLDLDYDLEVEKADFINQCRIYYRKWKRYLIDIDEFARTYTPKEAVQWYTKESFVYRLINKVFRQQNLRGIFAIRFFIRDLFYQLKDLYNDYLTPDYLDDGYICRCYRGQRMTQIELKNLTEGKLISANSFLSTTVDRTIALNFIGDVLNETDEDIQFVLFEIEIKIEHDAPLKRKPFAYISHLSHFEKSEEEVLIMVGSFFKIDKKRYDEEKKVWNVKVTLINEDDGRINITKDYQILKATSSTEAKVIRVGDLLFESGKSEQYYTLIKQKLPSMIAACYTGLGWMYYKENHLDNVSEIQLKTINLSDKPDLLVMSYCCMGAVFKRQKNYIEALEYYNKAHAVGHNIIPIDKYSMYDGYKNIASINIAILYLISSYSQKAWEILKTTLIITNKTYHCHLYITIVEAGLYENTNDKRQILQNWERFLDHSCADSSLYRSTIVAGLMSVGHKYLTKPIGQYLPSRDWNPAIDCFKKVVDLCHKYLPNKDDYSVITQCYKNIANILVQHEDYSRAISYYQKLLSTSLDHGINDVESMIACYNGVRVIFEQQMRQRNLSASDITDLLCEISGPVQYHSQASVAVIQNVENKLFKSFTRSNLAFGYLLKFDDISQICNESCLRQRLIYCYIKLAALFYENQKLDLTQQWLNRAIRMTDEISMEERNEITAICKQNRAFLDGDLTSIIDSYKELIDERIKSGLLCVNERDLCFIAYLYTKQNKLDQAGKWYERGVTYLQQNGHICAHTEQCYQKLSQYYFREYQIDESFTTYQNFVQHVIKPHPVYFTKLASIFIDVAIHYQKQKNFKSAFAIYQKFIDHVLKHSQDIISIIRSCKSVIGRYEKINEFKSAIHQYKQLLTIILDYSIKNTLTDERFKYAEIYIRDFADLALFFEKQNDLIGASNTYKTTIDLTLDHSFTIDDVMINYRGYADICLEKMSIPYISYAFYLCQRFSELLLKYHKITITYVNDYLEMIMTRYDSIASYYKKNGELDLAISVYSAMNRLMLNFHSEVNRNYPINFFIEIMTSNYMKMAEIYNENNDIDLIVELYKKLVTCILEYPSNDINHHMKIVKAKCEQHASYFKEHGLSQIANEMENKMRQTSREL